MFENIIFDFGQVLVHFEPFYMTERYAKNKEDIGLLAEVIFDRIYWDRLDDGSITDDEVKTAICERLPERLHSEAIEIYENWYFNIPIIEEMYEILNDLKAKGKKLYLLSNISKGFVKNYHRNTEVKEILDLFDGLIFSGELGIVKPSREIFDYIVQKYNLSKDATIFIDDNINNINGAKNFGISGYLFDGDAEKLREYL